MTSHGNRLMVQFLMEAMLLLLLFPLLQDVVSPKAQAPVRTEAERKAFQLQGPQANNELPSSLLQLDSLIPFTYKLK